jgi:hypothetical protein
MAWSAFTRSTWRSATRALPVMGSKTRRPPAALVPNDHTDPRQDASSAGIVDPGMFDLSAQMGCLPPGCHAERPAAVLRTRIERANAGWLEMPTRGCIGRAGCQARGRPERSSTIAI